MNEGGFYHNAGLVVIMLQDASSLFITTGMRAKQYDIDGFEIGQG